MEDPSLVTYKIDSYQFPGLLIKLLKSMKKNSVVQLVSTRMDKLRTNFKSEFFDQHSFKDGDSVKFTVTLLDSKHTKYFYRNPVAEKLRLVERFKEIAGNFFKIGNYSKASKIYQRINGFY